jgi:phosphatidylserine/phosphatidylglycerophosphate/cardiolipin synthase-like enzyme
MAASHPAAGAVRVRTYLSPGLVLLAFDWPDGARHPDFLGFAIRRAPGYRPGEKDAYLSNKIGFAPPGPDSQPLPSYLAPIQKFLWWDSGVNEGDQGKEFRYTVTPVLGTGPNDLELQQGAETTIGCRIPPYERDGIGTYFNRAVVSSQSFSRQFPDRDMSLQTLNQAMDWLANHLDDALRKFVAGSKHNLSGAIYHLTDKRWVIPALQKFRGKGSVVYYLKGKDKVSLKATQILKDTGLDFFPRTKTNIMHNKFLVRHTGEGDGAEAEAVLCGSANFTPEALTSQANLLHTFASPELADLYYRRQQELAGDPAVAATAKGAAWLGPVAVGPARVRVFFSPEPAGSRVSIDAVVQAVKAAKGSVVFCMFSPTDADLLNAMLAAGDRGKLLYGLLNSIRDPKKRDRAEESSGVAPPDPSPATEVQVTLYNRSRRDRKVLAYSYFAKGNAPVGFLPEFDTVDVSRWSTAPPAAGDRKHAPPAVHIHHKFIVIDAETADPVVYTGSANMSNNSVHKNDENLLEIRGYPELAQLYLAEFMRLYEHYRARAIWNQLHRKGKKRGAAGAAHATLTLKTTRDGWVRKAYQRNTPDSRARVNLASPPS